MFGLFARDLLVLVPTARAIPLYCYWGNGFHQVNLLLKLAQYMAEVFVFAEPRAAEMAELSQFCLVFLNSYASSHLGRVEAAVGELGAEALAQRSKGICSLLRLLSYLTSRDVAECLSIGAIVCESCQ